MDELKSINKLDEQELIKLKLKSGIEIHQQLEGKKLFCSCPTIIRDDEPDFIINRKLRSIAGESGEIDKAAIHETKKEKEFLYECYDDTTCLVELDEAPPENPNTEAVKSALILGKLFKMNFPDEIRFMRKTVVDGSNTSGFQRTAVVALDGELELEKHNKKIQIETICLEEDSCKNVEDNHTHKKYNLSRLGIPLIEIATGPDLKTPQEIKDCAEQIGMILRSLSNVKRGLGTIRQDINISIENGVRVELKGAQDLKLIPTIVEFEAIRQKNMLNLFKELQKRKSKVSEKIIDLTKTLEKSQSKVIKAGLSKKEGCILGVKLENFSGLLGFEIQKERRFGSELSDYAKTMGVKGLFHSDELPNYGITQQEKDLIYKNLNCDKTKDAFIIISDERKISKRAIKIVIERAKNFKLEPCVRMVKLNGSSSYMRPMPGASRMYPETDILPVKINLENIVLPKLLSEKITEMKNKFNLTEDVCKILIKEDIDLFSLTKLYPELKASYLVDYFFSYPSLIKKKFNLDVDVFKFQHEIFSKLNNNEITKESVIEILIKLSNGGVINYSSYKPLSIKDIEKDIKEIVLKNKDLPRGAIMGKVMSKYAGKIDGKEINNLISKLLN
ncbi:MAG: Glu-tRNA(Gln) amidotransferase subunit GatE [Candidatus Woesearchaeota archaeon]